MKLTPNSYILVYHLHSGYGCITIQSTDYDDNGNPTSWGIKSFSNTSMSKKDGFFVMEPMNSNKTDKFFKEFRFDTPEKAYKCWLKYQHNHTNQVNGILFKK